MTQTVIVQLALPIQIITEITDYRLQIIAINNHMVKNKFNQNQTIVRRRKQVVLRRHSKNQIVFNRIPVVTGQSFYKGATDRNKFFSVFQGQT